MPLPNYIPCGTCRDINVAGWYTCPKCTRHFCFKHCVGHDIEHPYTHPAVEPPPDATNVMHPWWWERFLVVLHTKRFLYLDDGAGERFIINDSARLGGLRRYMCLIGNGTTQAFRDYIHADSVEHLVQAMSPAQQQRLFALLQDVLMRAYDATRDPENNQEGDAP